jgi:hypothetical protein
VPLPLPPGVLVIVNHAAPLAAVHAHPLAAATEKLPVAAADPTDTLVGDKV